MEKKLMAVLRPIVAMLLVGIIVGLVFLYNSIDDDVNADNITPNIDNEQTMPDAGGDKVDNIDKEEIPNIEKPTLNIPRTTSSNTLNIGSNMTANMVLPFLGGSIIIGTANKNSEDFEVKNFQSIVIANINGKEFSKQVTIEENEDVKFVGAIVGESGLIIVATGCRDIYVYALNYDLKIIGKRLVENVDIDSVKVIGGDRLIMSYRKGGSIFVEDPDAKYTSNNIIALENTADVIGLFSLADDTIRLVFESGEVINMKDGNIISTQKIVDNIIDVEPIKIENNMAYGVISKGIETNIFNIYDREFKLLIEGKTMCNEILYVDKVYTIDRVNNIMEKYCYCGEYVGDTKININKIGYIDYNKKRMSYTRQDGINVISLFDGGIVNERVTSGLIIYMDDNVMISSKNNIIINYM